MRSRGSAPCLALTGAVAAYQNASAMVLEQADSLLQTTCLQSKPHFTAASTFTAVAAAVHNPPLFQKRQFLTSVMLS